MDYAQEMMSRCRWLVENRGEITIKYGQRTRRYADGVIAVKWEVPIEFPTDAAPFMTVVDARTGKSLGSYYGTTGGPRISDEEAEPITKHLRSVMLLDDIAEAGG